MITSLDVRVPGRAQRDPLLVPTKPRVAAPPATWLLDVPPRRRVALCMAQTMLGLGRREARKPARLKWLPRLVAVVLLLLPCGALSIAATLWILRNAL